MLKVGDKCKWTPKAIRKTSGEYRPIARREFVWIHSITEKGNVMVTRKIYSKPHGLYPPDWLVKV